MTYGIAVHIQNYATAGSIQYTNGAPTVFANADLSLTTGSSQHDPIFTGFNLDRMWNGTIYYNYAGPQSARTLMWVNGSTKPVSAFDFTNIDLDVQIDAFTGVGVDHDVWIFILTPIGVYSYGPSGWVYGIIPFASGPLVDLPKTNLFSMMLPAGNWLPVIALDDVMNGKLKAKQVVDMSYVPITISSFNQTPMTEDFQDGVADNWIDDGAHWSVFSSGVDYTYLLDCPSYARFVSYYDASPYADFTYSVDMMQEMTTSASMIYFVGMIFRSDKTLANCYDFYAEADGSVFLYSRVGGSGTVLYSNTLSTFWNVGHDAWNTVKVDCTGANIDLYINGNLETSVTDPTHIWGYIGLTGEGSGIYDHNYHFDNISCQ